MPIIELAFVIPKPELESRRQFDEKMPGVLSEQFSSLAKLHFAYSANVLEATGKDAASRDGVCLVIRKFTSPSAPFRLLRGLTMGNAAFTQADTVTTIIQSGAMSPRLMHS